MLAHFNMGGFKRKGRAQSACSNSSERARTEESRKSKKANTGNDKSQREFEKRDRDKGNRDVSTQALHPQ